MLVERDLTSGGEHMMRYADNMLQSCTPETCMLLLINVTPINSIKTSFMNFICNEGTLFLKIFLSLIILIILDAEVPLSTHLIMIHYSLV